MYNAKCTLYIHQPFLGCYFQGFPRTRVSFPVCVHIFPVSAIVCTVCTSSFPTIQHRSHAYTWCMSGDVLHQPFLGSQKIRLRYKTTLYISLASSTVCALCTSSFTTILYITIHYIQHGSSAYTSTPALFRIPEDLSKVQDHLLARCVYIFLASATSACTLYSVQVFGFSFLTYYTLHTTWFTCTHLQCAFSGV